MIAITSLFSGSRGNCTLVQLDNHNLLIDAGLSYRAIVRRLAQLNLTVKDISHVFITHEHSDHVNALTVLCNYNEKLVVHCHRSIEAIIKSKCANVVPFDDEVAVEGVGISSFKCSHDSTSCYGYIVSDGHTSVGIATDTGVASDEMVTKLSGCKTVLLESNHDIDLIDGGSYPPHLKRRIKSQVGHLSNDQAGQVLDKLLANGKLVNVVLCHLSEKNNIPETAFDCAMRVINNRGLVEGKDVNLFVASQYAGSRTIE